MLGRVRASVLRLWPCYSVWVGDGSDDSIQKLLDHEGQASSQESRMCNVKVSEKEVFVLGRFFLV